MNLLVSIVFTFLTTFVVFSRTLTTALLSLHKLSRTAFSLSISNLPILLLKSAESNFLASSDVSTLVTFFTSDLLHN